jgi:hypothetical protein
MNEPLVMGLFDAGILQFGRFAEDGDVVPLLLSWGMLVSYPPLLGKVAHEVATKVSPHDNYRLVCPVEVLPIGVVVSQHLQVPLVYQQQDSNNAVKDFVGAYDIGHPTCAILPTSWWSEMPRFLKRSESVGLKVEQHLHLIGDDKAHSIFVLDECLDALVASGRIKVAQREAVLMWHVTKTAS